MLILACSQRKRLDKKLLPAVERYDGAAFRVLRRFLRENQLNPNVREAGEPIFRYWEGVRGVVAAAWESEGENQTLLAALDLALDFQTWRTLTGRGQLHDEQAIELMIGMVRCRARK